MLWKLKKLVEKSSIKYRRIANSNRFAWQPEASKEALEEYLEIEMQTRETKVKENQKSTREILLEIQSQVMRNGQRLDRVEKDVSFLKKDMVEVKNDLQIIKSAPCIKKVFDAQK